MPAKWTANKWNSELSSSSRLISEPAASLAAVRRKWQQHRSVPADKTVHFGAVCAK